MTFQAESRLLLFFKRCLLVSFILFQSACSMVGIRNTEEASFTVIAQEGDFALRQYAPMVIAETQVDETMQGAERVAFNRLFDFITGDNVAAQDIAMTAPVITNRDSSKSGQKIAMTAPVLIDILSSEQSETSNKTSRLRYSFVMPKDINLENAPVPLNPLVSVKELPKKKVAVMSYTGVWDQEVFAEKVLQLKAWMINKGYEPDSSPSFAGYDPPWTLPFLRRNEVLIDVKN